MLRFFVTWAITSEESTEKWRCIVEIIAFIASHPN